MNKVYRQRFQELADQLKDIENTKTNSYSERLGRHEDFVDNVLLLNWKVKVRNLLAKVCGEESQHFRQLRKTNTAATPQTIRTCKD